MPTESNEFGPGKLLYKDQEGIIKELCCYENKEENNDDAADAMEYAVKGMTDSEISVSLGISKESTRKILKLYGLERITRKRFIKLLMGCGIQRNDANAVAKIVHNSKYVDYSPMTVQLVIEWAIKEMEKKENEMSRDV